LGRYTKQGSHNGCTRRAFGYITLTCSIRETGFR
jgi:hypothetical protein